jgi:2,5-diketo-D-gluconate reductase A
MATIQQQTPTRQPPKGREDGGLSPESNVRLRSGRDMPVLGLGSWMLTTHTAEAVMHAFELGYRMVDTSADYKTQPGIGKAIRLSQAPRESLFVSV